MHKKLSVNGSLYENDILAAYSLGRIHHNIYRLEESLIFLIVFPTPLSNVYTLYMPFTLPIKTYSDSWLKYSYPAKTRLIVFKNSTYIILILGWTYENQFTMFESDYLHNKVTGTMSSVPASNNNHMRIYALYGIWTVYNQFAILNKWETTYMCDNVNYSTPNNLDSLSLINNIDSERLVQQAHYERSSNSSILNELFEEQQILIANRSLRVKSLLKQIDLLITATNEGTSLFKNISKLFFN